MLIDLLSWVPALFGPTDWRRDGGGLSTALSLGLMCGGLESKFGRDLDPLIVEWWVGPACAWGTSGACVSGYPARHIDSRIVG